jgi:DNA repair protein RadA/Sms
VISAVLSSNLDISIDRGVCMAGEVGLSGEIRPVTRIEQRIREAEKLGFSQIIIPEMKGLETLQSKIEIRKFRKVEEAFRELFG